MTCRTENIRLNIRKRPEHVSFGIYASGYVLVNNCINLCWLDQNDINNETRLKFSFHIESQLSVELEYNEHEYNAIVYIVVYNLNYFTQKHYLKHHHRMASINRYMCRLNSHSFTQ